MLEKVDLEMGIFRILSYDDGPSQSELLDKLVKYSSRLKDKNIVLKVDKGNLSRKLKSLKKNNIIYHNQKKLDNRDQYAHSYFIVPELSAFEYIISQIAKDFDKSLDVSPLNKKDWERFLRMEDDEPIDLTRGTRCALIDALIKSFYVRKIIVSHGFESVYQIYKNNVRGYCDSREFINLASDGLRCR